MSDRSSVKLTNIQNFTQFFNSNLKDIRSTLKNTASLYCEAVYI